jgi:uncharacterized membrane protein (UPF0127 family)
MATDAARFRRGQGLWIVPCHGVHTFAMRFPIDVLYLDQEKIVIHIEDSLKPWRMAAIRARAASVLELPSGMVEETQTAVGDQVDIFFHKPKPSEAA